MLLVDSDVLIDVLSDDPQWRFWSECRLLEAAAGGELAAALRSWPRGRAVPLAAARFLH